MVDESSKWRKSSEEIAKGFRRGEPDAARAVRQRISRVVAFRGYSIPIADRSDLEQEIMAQLWSASKRPDFDESAGFWGFIELVATRRCIDWRRRQRDFVPLDPETPDSGDSPLQNILENERGELVSRALAEIGDPCRKLIELHFRRRKSYRELAGILGKGEGALRMQMFRCIRTLRAILHDLVQLREQSPEVTG